jgi:hypothetical protein
MGQIQKKRLIAMTFQELFSLQCQPIGQVFPCGSRFESRHLPFTARAVASAKGSEITERRAGMITSNIQVEALPLRLESFTTQMPFANMSSRVSGGPQRLRESGFLKRKLLAELWSQQLLIRSVRSAR